MNIEQIAVGIKDAHGLDMSDEAAITLLRHALSKLAEQAEKPVAWRYKYRFKDIGETGAYEYHSHDFVVVTRFPKGDSLYTEAQLIAAQQRTAEACAKVCEVTADMYQETESRLWPECRSDAQSGASSCEVAIRNGDWREYQ